MDKHLREAFVALLFASSCATPAILTPSTGKGTEYPCGVSGIECDDHTCCPPRNVCGGDKGVFGCPPGLCCYIGPSGEFGVRRPTPQPDAGR
jgi:hypothetical protein